MKNILFPLAVAALAIPGYAQNPRTPVQLDAGLGKAVGPAVSSEGDLTAIVWKEDITNQMFASTSTDNGNTWSTAIRIDDSPNANSKFAKDIGLVVDNGVIYSTWSDDRNVAFDADLYFTMSTDGGMTWSPNVAIDKGYPSGANDVKDWRIMANGNNIAVMCSTENDLGGFNEEVFLTVSTDGGLTFGTAMYGGANHDNGYSVRASGGNVYFLYDLNGDGDAEDAGE